VLLVGDIGGKLFGAVFMVLLARYLGATLFGELSFALAAAAILGVAADLGQTMLVAREVARRPEDPWAAAAPALKARALLTLALGTLALLATAFTGRPARVTELLAILLATQLVQGQAEILAAAHRGRERMTLPVAASLACRFGILLSGLVAIVLEAPVHVFAALTTIWTIPLPFVLGRALTGPERSERGPRPGVLRWLKAAAPIGVGVVLWTIYFRVDLVALGWLRGDRDVGLYAASFRLVEAGLLISGPLLAAVFPLLSRLDPSDEVFRAGLRQSARALGLLGWPAAAFCAVEAPHIIAALYGAEYAASAGVLRILGFAIPLAFLSAPVLTLLIGTDRERIYAYIMGAGAVMNVTLDLLIIPAHGPEGAAAATLATEGVVLALSLAAYARLGLPPLRTLLPVRAAVVGLVVAASLHLLRLAGLPFPARAAIGLLAIYPAAAFLLGAVRIREIRLLLPTRP